MTIFNLYLLYIPINRFIDHPVFQVHLIGSMHFDMF